jgi:hypothetical protein
MRLPDNQRQKLGEKKASLGGCIAQWAIQAPKGTDEGRAVHITPFTGCVKAVVNPHPALRATFPQGKALVPESVAFGMRMPAEQGAIKMQYGYYQYEERKLSIWDVLIEEVSTSRPAWHGANKGFPPGLREAFGSMCKGEIWNSNRLDGEDSADYHQRFKRGA